MPFKLTSYVFGDGGKIPPLYSCQGEDVSPPLAWSGAPAGVKSFALFCDDPDAPRGTFHHWGIFDMPAALDRLGEGHPGEPYRQAINDFGNPGYGGPCPPRGQTHHYRFKLLALDAEKLDVPANVKCADAEKAARAHLLAEETLTGLFAIIAP